MVNELFGGSDNQWSYGWSWMWCYLDVLYKNILGLRDHCSSGMTFLASLMQLSNMWQNQNGIYQWEWRKMVVNWSKQTILSIDGFCWQLQFETNVTFSGPDGGCEGAPCKEQYEITRKSIYMVWKIRHYSFHMVWQLCLDRYLVEDMMCKVHTWYSIWVT